VIKHPNKSPDWPCNVGYFMNVISALRERHKIAQVQVRLIAQEMEKMGLCESYGLDRQQQMDLFVTIIKRITGVQERSALLALD
jgi:hypothetical protein